LSANRMYFYGSDFLFQEQHVIPVKGFAAGFNCMCSPASTDEKVTNGYLFGISEYEYADKRGDIVASRHSAPSAQ
jgi:hypothetical protein